ncbi:hypothetical protein T492DRAFT_435068 [Pavlovales sp. CCMP2436]|nr:hypothetical protein T492DRAFT_435068 [Pavlovales sp. CCMP2436]
MDGDDGGDAPLRRVKVKRVRQKTISGYQRRLLNPNSSAGIMNFKRFHKTQISKGSTLEFTSYASAAALSVSRSLLAELYGRRMAEAAAIVPATIQAFSLVPESTYLLAFEVLRALPGRGQQASLFLRRLSAVDTANAPELKLALACHQLETGRMGDARQTLTDMCMSHGARVCGGGAVTLSAALSFQTTRMALLGAENGSAKHEHEPELELSDMRWDLVGAPHDAGLTLSVGLAEDEEEAEHAAGLGLATGSAREALRALDAASASGALSSGLAFCRAQIVALASGCPDEAVALLREHANAVIIQNK